MQMGRNWEVWAQRNEKEACPCKGCELVGSVNLCLALTFGGGNELPTTATTAKCHNNSIRRTTEVTAMSKM